MSTDAVLHLAEVAHWEEALRTGEYRWSTLGRTLEEEGFIHCSTPEQVPGVLARYYAAYAGDLAAAHRRPRAARRTAAVGRREHRLPESGSRTCTARSPRMP